MKRKSRRALAYDAPDVRQPPGPRPRQVNISTAASIWRNGRVTGTFVLSLAVLANGVALASDSVGRYDAVKGKFYLIDKLHLKNTVKSFRLGPKRSNWLPLSGDWDGNGTVTMGLYDPTKGQFHLTNSEPGGHLDRSFEFGPKAKSIVPVSGDWNGNGVTTIGVYDRRKGKFWLRNKNRKGTADRQYRFGPQGSEWAPVIGDWNGNGIDSVGVYSSRKGQFKLKHKHKAGKADISFLYGPKGLKRYPVSGDWDGDGSDGVGLLAPGTGYFFLKNSPAKGSADYIVRLARTSKSSRPVMGSWSQGRSAGSGELALYLPGLEPIGDKAWDQNAVRRVLDVFAYGGQATDQQIFAWAAMPPRAAIVEMLTFAPHNLKLSPPAPGNVDRLHKRPGTLQGLSDFWTSDVAGNGVDVSQRARYEEDGDIEKLWVRAALSRGLNPFRQRIGLWETNYHLAVNENVGVRDYQIVRYYDTIMSALARNEPYQDVLTRAATSAAIAMQYGHRNSAYVSGECRCNEDFAREYHQLFFGILGDYNPTRHETVTIKNTAKALTDMPVPWLAGINRYAASIDFGTEHHYPGTLGILGRGIGGSNAYQRIDQLSQVTINHPESLANLPVKIVAGLADDNLDAHKTKRLRQAWAAMSSKNLLYFLRAYAISTIFHQRNRLKLYTSLDRHLLRTNKMTLSNNEGHLNLYGEQDFRYEDVRVFRPRHNVFGGQTGAEAADSAGVFQHNWSRVTNEYWRYNRYTDVVYGREWTKDWAAVIPRSGAGIFVVGEVGEWLWHRFVGDGLRRYGPLERAYVVSLLASDRDLQYLLDYNDLERVLSSAEAANDPLVKLLIDTLANQPMLLESGYEDDRKRAHERIGTAINFILGTPYVFAQEGR